MRTILLAALLLSGIAAYNQDVKKLRDESSRQIKKDPKDTANKIWKAGGLFNLNVAQGSIKNWAAGGDEFSLALNSILSVYAFYKKDKKSWDNTLDFTVGFVNTTSLGSRKNDDRFDLLSKYGYSIAPKWNLSALFNFRTQFFPGYSYSGTGKTLTSDFLSPAYVLLSPGFDYKPNDEFSFFISPATARWIIVQNDFLSSQGAYGVDSGQHTKFQFGAFSTIGYLKALNPVLTYKGRLDLFSNYLHNPQNISVYMTNLLSVKISKVLSASWNVDLIYDDNVKMFGVNKNSPALQFMSIVGVGLALKF
jgi:Protein of unknown function (DUF3078).